MITSLDPISEQLYTEKNKVSFENCKGVAFGSPDKHAMVSFLTPLRFNNDTLMVS